MTDKTLCQKLKNGSRRALREAIDRFTPYVSTAAWRVLAAFPRRAALGERSGPVPGAGG